MDVMEIPKVPTTDLPLLDLAQHGGEGRRRVPRQLHGQLRPREQERLGLGHVPPHQFRCHAHKLLLGPGAAVHEREGVAEAVVALQLKRGAHARQGAPGHDGDAVAEYVRLVHEVRGQHHHPPRLVAPHHVPREASAEGVHAGGRLV
eukprot:1187046-Pyramimonas_sp.AAC.1